jgi:hypothetical protein
VREREGEREIDRERERKREREKERERERDRERAFFIFSLFFWGAKKEGDYRAKGEPDR